MKIKAVSLALSTIILLSIAIPLATLWIILNTDMLNTMKKVQTIFIKNIESILNDVKINAILREGRLELIIGSRSAVKISKIMVYNLTSGEIRVIQLNTTTPSNIINITLAKQFSTGKLDVVIIDDTGRIYRYDPRFDPLIKDNPYNNDPYLDPQDFIVKNNNSSETAILPFLVFYDIIGLRVLEANYTIILAHLNQTNIPGVEAYIKLYHPYGSNTAYYQAYVKVNDSYELNTGWRSGTSTSVIYSNVKELLNYANIKLSLEYSIRLTFRIKNSRLYNVAIYTLVNVKAVNNSTKKALIAIPVDVKASGELTFNTGTLPVKCTEQQDPYQNAYRLTQFKYVILEPNSTCELFHKAYSSSSYYTIYGALDVVARSYISAVTNAQIVIILLEES